ncbi:manganese efflux pump MntP [Clostridium guangxiense]|uniref:manganese efflux pump MntP n=1 Tax=Clostridium guangxiense TaxID=1662055 RepID=UPI001E43B196|nr:manganese efflux pump [Clostridium guangxiense]MCD2347340.1 manganese efflux pump MntP family protein [Clostridium guangxiense]
MSIYLLFIIAVALSLDAFGVALSIGFNEAVKKKNKIFFALSFGTFQALLTFIGAYAGFVFNTYIITIPQIIGGTVISIVGVLMIKDGFEKKTENILLSFKMYIILGISVSIDAAVVGFTIFNNINSNYIVITQSIFIGIMTFVLSNLAFFVAKFLRKIELIKRYADYIGGVILVLFGIKMMFF